MTEFSETLLALDPGRTTGFIKVSFDLEKKRATLLQGGEIKADDFYSWLDSQHVDKYIVEDYIIRPAKMVKGFGHDWNRGETLQLIGYTKGHAMSKNREVILQQPSIKPAAYGWLGKKYVRGKPGMHTTDAAAHLIYYLVTRRGCTPDVFKLQSESGQV